MVRTGSTAPREVQGSPRVEEPPAPGLRDGSWCLLVPKQPLCHRPESWNKGKNKPRKGKSCSFKKRRALIYSTSVRTSRSTHRREGRGETPRASP